MSAEDEGCPYCFPGECIPSTHEAAVQAEYEAETCKLCGAPPGDACDISTHDLHVSQAKALGEFAGASQVATGFGAVDHLAPVRIGDLWILASRPGHGHLAFALKLCLNVVRRSVPVLWFGLAHSAEDLMGPLLAARGREAARMASAAMELAELPLSVVDSTESSLSRIRELTQAWRSQNQDPRALVVVDHLQAVPREGGSARVLRPLSEEQGEVAAGLKVMAKRLGVAVLLLARHHAADRLPELRDLTRSAADHADVVAFLHRAGACCQLIVAQQKNGPVGTIDLALALHPKFCFLSDDETPQGASPHVD